jgi:hypothetical protein
MICQLFCSYLYLQKKHEPFKTFEVERHLIAESGKRRRKSIVVDDEKTAVVTRGNLEWI